MPFTIPNYGDATYPDQAEPDSIDFNILASAISGNGVVSGCAVSAQGTPNMTVAISAGTVLISGTTAIVSAGNLTITAADSTNPRFDLITVDSLGTKSVTSGTASTNAVFPSPVNEVVLAAIYVPAGTTSISSNQIVDKRTLVNSVAGGQLSGYYPNPNIGTGVITDANISGTAAIANSKLANSSVTVNGTSVSLGGTATVSAAPSGSAGGDLTGTYPNPTLGTTGVTAGTYSKVTVDTKGRITAGATAALSDLSVPASDINLNNKKILNLATPTLSTDAANKAYVDSYITGLDFKPSVRVATTGSVNIASAPASIDGITLSSGNRVLVKDQSTSDSANGIYVFNGSGSAMTRAADVDEPFEVTSGMFTFVEEGDTNANSGWTLITDTNPVAIGTTALQFSQFSASPLLASSTPTSLSGAASVGTATSAARADHQHGTSGVASTSGKLSQFAATTSSELAGIISDETGSGSLVFGSSPILTTPNIGEATGTSLNISSGTITAGALAGSLLSLTAPADLTTSGTYGVSTIPARSDHAHSTNGLVVTSTVTTTGDLLVASSNATVTRLAPGTSGYVLTSNGTANIPSWQTAPSTSITTLVKWGL